MPRSKKRHDLLYKYEILRAKLEVRDHYFNSIVKDIYENTGQALSLVGIQLAIMGARTSNDLQPYISKSSHLISRAIVDLREMSRNFFPENEILSESGLENALKRELGIGKPGNSDHQIKVIGIPFALTLENGMVFFFVVLEIITCLVNLYGVKAIELEIIYSDTRLNLIIRRCKKKVSSDTLEDIKGKLSPDTWSNIKDRIHLIGGRLTTKNVNGRQSIIDISIPYEENKVA